MTDTTEVLEQAYTDLVYREAVWRPRIDIQIPTNNPGLTMGNLFNIFNYWRAP